MLDTILHEIAHALAGAAKRARNGVGADCALNRLFCLALLLRRRYSSCTAVSAWMRELWTHHSAAPVRGATLHFPLCQTEIPDGTRGDPNILLDRCNRVGADISCS